MSTYVNMVVSLFSLMSLFIIVFWLYRDYRVDAFRQQMFVIRDEFFDASLKSGISFTSPAYGLTRSTMNGFIRFGHRMGLLQTVACVLMVRKKIDQLGGTYSAKLEKAMGDLSKEQQEIIKDYNLRMNMCFMKHIFLSSPIGSLSLILIAIPAVVPAIIGILCAELVVQVKQLVFKQVARLAKDRQRRKLMIKRMNDVHREGLEGSSRVVMRRVFWRFRSSIEKLDTAAYVNGRSALVS